MNRDKAREVKDERTNANASRQTGNNESTSERRANDQNYIPGELIRKSLAVIRSSKRPTETGKKSKEILYAES